LAKSLNQYKQHLINQPSAKLFLLKNNYLIGLRAGSLFSALCLTSLASSTMIMPIQQAYAADTFVASIPLDHVVASVDDSIILSSDVEQALVNAKAQITAHKQTLPSDEMLRADVIRQLILRKIQLGIIARNGSSIDEKTLNAAISNIAQQQGAPSLEAFQSKLDTIKPNGYSIFRQQILDDLNIQQLQQQRVSNRIKITDKDVDNFLSSPQSAEALKTEYNFNVIQVALANRNNPQDVAKATAYANEVLAQLRAGKSIESLMSTYPIKGGEQGWHKSDELPTPFVEALSSLKRNEFSRPFTTLEGVDILQLKDMRGAAGAMVHQYHVRHILVKTNEVMNSADAKLKIDDIYNKIKLGASFADMAKSYSDDPGSAQNGGDLNWVSTGEMVPVFEEQMLHTPIGQLSKPFQSSYGWHILQVEAERDEDMTQQYRRNAAKQALYERQYPVELDNWLREIRATAYIKLFDSAA
jgi:peptidyl-prolyl cis-trans isomerase SurA